MKKEALKFFFTFLFLGAHILNVISDEIQVDYVKKKDILHAVDQMMAEADKDNDGVVTSQELSDWFKNTDESWIVKLQEDVQRLHQAK